MNNFLQKVLINIENRFSIIFFGLFSTISLLAFIPIYFPQNISNGYGDILGFIVLPYTICIVLISLFILSIEQAFPRFRININITRNLIYKLLFYYCILILFGVIIFVLGPFFIIFAADILHFL